MPVPGAEGLDKLEDMIVRAAETTAAHVRSAKAAIGVVIFGQDRVVERALITVLSGGHGLLVALPRPNSSTPWGPSSGWTHAAFSSRPI
jgi:MoxR-like ATPase